MTERLAQLLRAEADTLDLPPPDAGTAMSRGRGLRRRRRLVTGVAAAAALVMVAGTALGVNALGGDDNDSKIDPAAPFDSGAVFSIGTTVYLDDGALTAAIGDDAIKSLHYTSVGVLVRHGDNNWSDGGGPQRFSMVSPDGTVSRMDVTLEETVHATDPTEPYLAYAEVTNGQAEVVVHDLRDDTEVARIAIPSADPGGGWDAPAVSLAGDIVYVGTAPTPYAVNWRTGDVQETDAVSSGIPGVQGGRISSYSGPASVIDVATGETLLTVPDKGYFNLSPDGRYAMFSSEDALVNGEVEGVDVYSVDTGDHVTLPGAAWDYGWTGKGDLFTVTKKELTTCHADTGECTSIDHGIEMPPATAPEEICDEIEPGVTECYQMGGGGWQDSLRLGGKQYES